MFLNKFLNAYDKIVKSKQISEGLMPGYHLKNEIEKFAKKEKEQNFYSLITYLYNNFLSWKLATKTPGYQVPTTKNTVEQINNIIDEGKLIVNCNKEYLTSKKHLKKSLSSKNQMKEIYLKFK